MMSLSSVLDRVRQRTGTQDLFTRSGLTAFQSAVKTDFGNIASQWNTALYPLLASIAEPSGVDALVKGLSGNTLWSDVDATVGSNSLFWSATLGRRLTIKESLDVLAVQLAAASRAGFSSLLSIPYAATRDLFFDNETNARAVVDVLIVGSGAFQVPNPPEGSGVFYLDTGGEEWLPAQADTAANGVGVFKAIHIDSADGGNGYMLRHGIGRITDPVSAWSDTPPTVIGSPIYLSTSDAGLYQSAIPADTDEAVNIIGYVLAVNEDDSIDVYYDLNETFTVIP
jgi:hypothetical protein